MEIPQLSTLHTIVDQLTDIKIPMEIPCLFLASPDALEVIVVTDWLTHLLTQSALALTWLMWPWWVMIPIEDLTNVTLAIQDTDKDDEGDEDDEEGGTDVPLVSDDIYWRLD